MAPFKDIRTESVNVDTRRRVLKSLQKLAVAYTACLLLRDILMKGIISGPAAAKIPNRFSLPAPSNLTLVNPIMVLLA